MAAIYLYHPIHGHKVACSDLEAEHDENCGWERYTIDTPVIEEVAVEEPVVEEEQVEAAPANTLEVKTRRRKTTA